MPSDPTELGTHSDQSPSLEAANLVDTTLSPCRTHKNKVDAIGLLEAQNKILSSMELEIQHASHGSSSVGCDGDQSERIDRESVDVATTVVGNDDTLGTVNISVNMCEEPRGQVDIAANNLATTLGTMPLANRVLVANDGPRYDPSHLLPIIQCTSGLGKKRGRGRPKKGDTSQKMRTQLTRIRSGYVVLTLGRVM